MSVANENRRLLIIGARPPITSTSDVIFVTDYTPSTELRLEDIEDAVEFEPPARYPLNREQRRKLKKR